MLINNINFSDYLENDNEENISNSSENIQSTCNSSENEVKICETNNQSGCTTTVDNNNDIGNELKLAILRKAAELKVFSTQKEVEEYRKKNQGKPTYVGQGEGAEKN